MSTALSSVDLYAAGAALITLTKAAASHSITYSLAGRLQLSDGWLVLTVPASLIRGAFDALHEPGAALPERFSLPIMSPQELDRLGGAAKVTERGHQFSYALGPTVAHEPGNGISRVVSIRIFSPELKKLRQSYGLTPYLKGTSFALPIAVRKTGVLGQNELSKLAECLQDPDYTEFDEEAVKSAAPKIPIAKPFAPPPGLAPLAKLAPAGVNPVAQALPIPSSTPALPKTVKLPAPIQPPKPPVSLLGNEAVPRGMDRQFVEDTLKKNNVVFFRNAAGDNRVGVSGFDPQRSTHEQLQAAAAYAKNNFAPREDGLKLQGGYRNVVAGSNIRPLLLSEHANATTAPHEIGHAMVHALRQDPSLASQMPFPYLASAWLQERQSPFLKGLGQIGEEGAARWQAHPNWRAGLEDAYNYAIGKPELAAAYADRYSSISPAAAALLRNAHYAHYPLKGSLEAARATSLAVPYAGIIGGGYYATRRPLPADQQERP